MVKKDEKYFLDGHYCLLNYKNEPEKIDYETFNRLNPFAFAIVIDEVQEIKSRLEKRDNKEYNFDLLLNFQNLEIEYSIELSNKIKKPHLTLKTGEINNLKVTIQPPLAAVAYRRQP